MSFRKKESLGYKLLNFLIWSINESINWFEVLSSKHYYLKSGPAYKKGSLQRAIRRLEKVGYIEKESRKGDVFLKLTSLGKNKLIKEIPLPFLAQKKWDGVFRGIAFDIPEEKKRLRERLREHLKTLGFGMLQRSFWVTPYPLTKELDEFIESQGLASFALVTETKHFEKEKARKLAKKIWKLEKIAKVYEGFIKKWQERLEQQEDLAKFVGEWRGEFFELLKIDPYLPKELLPEDWPKEEAKKIFVRLERSIRGRM